MLLIDLQDELPFCLLISKTRDSLTIYALGGSTYSLILTVKESSWQYSTKINSQNMLSHPTASIPIAVTLGARFCTASYSISLPERQPPCPPSTPLSKSPASLKLPAYRTSRSWPSSLWLFSNSSRCVYHHRCTVFSSNSAPIEKGKE